MSTVAKRYAGAAIEAASEKGGTEAVEKLVSGLEAFQQAAAGSRELADALKNPALKNARAQVLEAVLKKLGVAGEASKLVKLLAENDRFEELEEITAATRALADERAGRVRAHVKSATALSDSQKDRLGRALEKRFGRQVVMQVQVEPELLGGIVVEVGDTTLDSSLRKQLSLLRDRLLA